MLGHSPELPAFRVIMLSQGPHKDEDNDKLQGQQNTRWHGEMVADDHYEQGDDRGDIGGQIKIRSHAPHPANSRFWLSYSRD